MFLVSLFIVCLMLSAIATYLFKGKVRKFGWLVAAVALSVAVTIYSIKFDNDPQGPIFLFIVYPVIWFGSALGAVFAHFLSRE